jgi:acyl-CoA thioesterase
MFPDSKWEDSTFVAPQNPDYGVWSGAFGGWTAAHAVTSALPLMTAEQVPVALTVDFVKGVAAGEVRSKPQIVSASKSTTFVNIATSQNAALCASTSLIFSRRRDTDHHALLQAPAAPMPHSVPQSEFTHPIATWIAQYEMRFVEGRLLQPNPHMRSLVWMRPQPARRWSWPVLAGFVDANFPRIYFHYQELSAIATVTMSAHFHLTAAEFDALGDDYLLVDASAALAHAGLYDQTVRIWSRSGALVATSTQIAVFSVKSDTQTIAP